MLTPSPTLIPSATPTLTPTPIPPQVVIISIDGLRPDAVMQADAIEHVGQMMKYTP
jgi:predicted AlkP superfamily pyrophosphatase or phosphodiesterase